VQLTWNAHGEQMASKISRNIYLLRNLANNLPLQSLRLAYFALVHCHIEYGILIWGHSGTLYCVFNLVVGRKILWYFKLKILRGL
jgi:hypothetical protein